MQGKFNLDFFDRALIRREAHLLKESCLRVFDGLGDGCSGLVIDKFQDICIVHTYSDDFTFDWCNDNLKAPLLKICKTAYVWSRSADNDSRSREARLLLGERQEELIAQIDNLKVLLRPERVPQAGIFLDSKAIRDFIANKNLSGRILNTFAYTGSLGLSAYLAGAAEVVQIDSNSGILAWAKENFELNKFDGGGLMRFIEDDVLAFLDKEARRIQTGKRELYQMIILDPPTIGRSERGLFKVHHDLPALIESATRCLSRGGYLVVSLNAPDISIEIIELYLDKVVGDNRRSYQIIESLLPDAILYPTHHAESSVMRGLIAQLR